MATVIWMLVALMRANAQGAVDQSGDLVRTTLRSSRAPLAVSLAAERRPYSLFPPVLATPSASPARARMSKRKAVLIGASIGGGGGAAMGGLYCRSDCGGGPTRGALVFAPVGAAIGAGVGLILALLPSP